MYIFVSYDKLYQIVNLSKLQSYSLSRLYCTKTCERGPTTHTYANFLYESLSTLEGLFFFPGETRYGVIRQHSAVNKLEI